MEINAQGSRRAGDKEQKKNEFNHNRFNRTHYLNKWHSILFSS